MKKPPKVSPLKQLKLDAEAAMKKLEHFISARQLHVVRQCMKGEEAEYFCTKMIAMAKLIETMAATYDQDGKGDNAMVYLHYFAGGAANWWITEKDRGEDPEPGQPRDDRQHQAFGLANLFGGPNDQDAELGYISIQELIEHNAELDFHFTPRTLGELKGRTASAAIVPDDKGVAFPDQTPVAAPAAAPAKLTASAAAAALAAL